MKIYTLGLMAAAALLAGCAGSHGSHNESMGGSSDIDHNVLTGGPITGTTLNDLPQPVKATLKRYDPYVEISDIQRFKSNNQLVYRFNFVDSLHNPSLYVMDNGGVWWDSSLDR